MAKKSQAELNEEKRKDLGKAIRAAGIKGAYVRTLDLVELRVDGKTKRVNVEGLSRQDAVEKVAAVAREMGQVREGEIPPMSVLIDRYCTVRRVSPARRKVFEYALKGLGNGFEKDRETLAERFKGKKDGTILTQMTAIKTIFNFAAENGYTMRDPTDGMRRPKKARRTRVPTDEEVEFFLRLMESKPDEDRLFALLLMETGARCSTIERLTPDCMTSDWAIKLYNVKLRRPYKVSLPIRSEALRELWTKLTKDRPKNELVFTSTAPRQHLMYLMRKHFSPDSNGERLSPHSWRHWKATQMMKAGVPIKVAAAVLDDGETTLLSIYQTVDQTAVDKWI